MFIGLAAAFRRSEAFPGELSHFVYTTFPGRRGASAILIEASGVVERWMGPGGGLGPTTPSAATTRGARTLSRTVAEAVIASEAKQSRVLPNASRYEIACLQTQGERNSIRSPCEEVSSCPFCGHSSQ